MCRKEAVLQDKKDAWELFLEWLDKVLIHNVHIDDNGFSVRDDYYLTEMVNALDNITPANVEHKLSPCIFEPDYHRHDFSLSMPAAVKIMGNPTLLINL